jgi:hypothetical protein
VLDQICDSCVRFGEQMAGTKEGVEALQQVLGTHNKMRFWTIRFVQCVLRKCSIGVCDL